MLSALSGVLYVVCVAWSLVLLWLFIGCCLVCVAVCLFWFCTLIWWFAYFVFVI